MGSHKKSAGSKAQMVLNASKGGVEAVSKPTSPQDVQGISNTSSSSASSSTTSPYLTTVELNKLKQDEKLVLDMYPLLKKRVNIYATAEIVRSILDSAKMTENFVKGTSKHTYRELLQVCLNADHEELFHNMNTGKEGAMLKWQRFSVSCLMLAATQHLTYSKPFPIKLDNDPTVPPSKRAAHARARIKLYTKEMAPFYDEIMSGKRTKKGGSVTVIEDHPHGRRVVQTYSNDRRAKFPYDFSPDELGPDEHFILDVSALIPSKTVQFIINRNDVLTKFDFVRCREDVLTDAGLQLIKAWYTHLRQECIDLDTTKVTQDSRTFADNCAMVAVFARLLFGTPLCIKSLEKKDRDWLGWHLAEGEDGESSVPLPDSKPTPSILGQVGGYELRCKFKEGGPEHVVHLPLSTFTDDEMVVLDATELLGWPAMLPVHCYFISSLFEKHGSTAEKDQSTLQNILKKLITMAKQVNPTIVDHRRAGCEKAQEQLWQLAAQCAGIASFQHVLYKQPIKIAYYPGIEETLDYNEEVITMLTSYVKRAMEETVRILSSQGVPFDI